jgi:hypothetical protein
MSYNATNDGTSTVDSSWVVHNGELFAKSSGGTGVTMNLKNSKDGINPRLVFKLMKKKFNFLGQVRYKKRINKLKKLVEEYEGLGHHALSNKFRNKIVEEMAFAEVTGAGIKYWIDKKEVEKNLHKVRGGHIADTDFDKYTRVIPKNILKRKKELDKYKFFSKYVIYHYWDEKLEKKKEKKEKLSSKEKSDMKDPILFGVREDQPDKLYFIADWEDEYCDLTFTDLIDELGIEDEDVKIPLLQRLFPKNAFKYVDED